MKISIGILAYNEAESIADILHSLYEQSLLQDIDRDKMVEIIVVPNGCKDNTATVAKNTLQNLSTQLDSALFQWQVYEVSEAGKSNAWNLFIHLVRVTEASHVFEAYTNPFELINHEVRVVVGIVINIFLTHYFREICDKSQLAGPLIAKMNRENHWWLNNFMNNTLAKKSWWVIPISLVFRRYRSLKNHSPLKAVLRIPIATLAFIVDMSVFIRANQNLHRKVITNYW